MSESADYIAQLPWSGRTAEEFIDLLIQLITKTTDVEQLDDDVVESTFDIQLESFADHKRDYAARLTSEWSVGIVLSDDGLTGKLLKLRFFDNNGRTKSDLTGICGIDSAGFSAALTEAGFEQRPVNGVHGERQGQKYDRGLVHVYTLTRGEANQSHHKISHECITTVGIQHA